MSSELHDTDADACVPLPVLVRGLTLVLTPPLRLHLVEHHTDHSLEWLSPQEQLQIPATSPELSAVEQRQLYWDISQHLAAKVTTTIMFWLTVRDERMYRQGLMGLHDSADCVVCPAGR